MDTATLDRHKPSTWGTVTQALVCFCVVLFFVCLFLLMLFPCKYLWIYLWRGYLICGMLVSPDGETTGVEHEDCKA